MNKSWLHLDRISDGYRKGVNDFLDLAFSKVGDSDQICCPCKVCRNVVHMTRPEVALHLVKNGMDETYTTWTLHGEEMNANIDETSANVDAEDKNLDDANTYEMLHTLITAQNWSNMGESSLDPENASYSQEPNPEAKKFFNLLDEAKQELYPNCKITKLSFIIRFFQLKCLHGLSDNACEGIIELIRLVLPDSHCVPKTLYNCRKITRDLGLSYEKIDACVNDCILFRNEYAELDKCPNCLAPRWKSGNENDQDGSERDASRKQSKVAQKVFRYFPLTPRLKRLFMSENTSKNMRWHQESRVNDGVLRHPADSSAWKEFDSLHQTFSSDSRNVRLGLATDGFNPFGAMNVQYSVWPVVLIPYNLPPWLCMKQPFWILSMIIPGPRSPGNDIDVYLRPLIDELKHLWNDGVVAYDAATCDNFILRAAVVWTINDYPAYAMASGWSTKGKLACAPCKKETSSLRLRNGHKECYMAHRRFLRDGHPYRRNSDAFDGTIENRPPPEPLSGDDILDQYSFFQQVRLA